MAGQGKYDSFSGVQGGEMRDVFPFSHGFSSVEGAMQDNYGGGDGAASGLKQEAGLRGLPPPDMHIYTPGD